MTDVFDALTMWALLQVPVVWFCTRLAAVRELDHKDSRELQEYVARMALDRAGRSRLPSGVCSSVTVSPCMPLEETPA